MAEFKNTTISDSGFIQIPAGTTAQRPGSPNLADFRFNTDDSRFEIWNGSQWASVGKAAGPGLYEFTTATFTPGGATRRNGPSLTQARNGITAGSGTDWVNDTQFLNTRGTQGGIIVWTVPRDGTYSIDAYGAQGGRDGNYNVNGSPGARIKGDFDLTEGQVLNLVVGQQGSNDNGSRWGGGGGGGSFVWVQDQNSAPLIAAGGGGSGGQGSSSGSPGQTGTSGGTCQNGSAGGTNGQSGAGGSCGGGNGQGWFGGTTRGCGGQTNWVPVYQDPTGAGGASAGQSSDGSSSYGVGGFGGGQGAYGGGGGGGGYSGGGSAGWAYSYYAGGGGSFNAGANQINTAGARNGNGQIIITLI